MPDRDHLFAAVQPFVTEPFVKAAFSWIIVNLLKQDRLIIFIRANVFSDALLSSWILFQDATKVRSHPGLSSGPSMEESGPNWTTADGKCEADLGGTLRESVTPYQWWDPGADASSWWVQDRVVCIIVHCSVRVRVTSDSVWLRSTIDYVAWQSCILVDVVSVGWSPWRCVIRDYVDMVKLLHDNMQAT